MVIGNNMPKLFTKTLTIVLTLILTPLLVLPLAQAKNPEEVALKPTILVVGDSISAEYGLKRGSGWLALLQNTLIKENFPHRIVNASISGETTSGGANRIDALIKQHSPRIVILELGGNDALRGLSLKATQENMDRMAKAVRNNRSELMILGMEIPPNYGMQYATEFRNIFKKVSAQHKAVYLPFLFEGFGQDLSAFQTDRIHPNEAAQEKILANVWPLLKPLLLKTAP